MNIKEFEILQAGEVDKLGGVFYGLKQPNNHKYKKDIKYLHFFKDPDTLDEYFRSINFVKDDSYVVATFNIPFRKLLLHTSIGKYMPSGYDCDYITEMEFALPIKDFKLEYFIEAKPVPPFKVPTKDLEK